MCVCSVFKKDLEKDVAGDTSGDFAKLLLALVVVRNYLHSVHDGTLLPCIAYYNKHSSLNEGFRFVVCFVYCVPILIFHYIPLAYI